MNNHPHYGAEKAHLDRTVEAIHAALQRPVGEAGADRAANRAMRDLHAATRQELMEAAAEPYFARVDWHADSSPAPEELYIGLVGLRSLKMNVYSWMSPFAKAVYMLEQPDGETGKVLLKRTFRIAGNDLQEIHDEYVDPSLADTLVAEQFTDSLLVRLLQENRVGELHQIVATIQARQYEIIRMPYKQVLVVQGVAGSGKTSLALHRLAYLLYNYENLQRVLVLGPNHMFMNYIAGILPALGSRDIPQLTFDAWIMQMLGSAVEVEPQDASLETLLDTTRSRAEKLLHYRNARNKGSLAMMALLDRYVEQMANEALDGKDSLICPFDARVRYGARSADVLPFLTQEERTVAAIRELLAQHRHLPLNERRAAVEAGLVRDIGGAIWRKVTERLRAQRGSPTLADDEQQHVRRSIRDSVTKRIHTYFDNWKAENVSVAYRRLLRNPGLLAMAGADLFAPQDLELLAQDAPKPQRPFRFSDLAALLYLKIRLDGTGDTIYDHIVVDEAQDLTPLHFRVLHAYSRNGSLTLLGDLAQSIYIHHSIDAWKDLTAAFGGRAPRVETIRESYRSTEQLVNYTNDLLDRTGTPVDMQARPIARLGPEPLPHAFARAPERAAGIAALLRDLSSTVTGSCAIVCKTLSACRALNADLHAAGLEDYRFVQDRDTEYKGGTILLPAYLTKGLEFDTVIVADADDQTYTLDQLDMRLLYVVLTRAAHNLHICWIGRPTPLLENGPTITLTPALRDTLSPRLTSLAAYARRRGGRSADWYVERLASRGKLPLLQDGTIEEALVDVILRDLNEEQRTFSEETGPAKLDTRLAVALQTHADQLSASSDPRVQQAMAFTQLTFGLLRHVLAAADLAPPAEGLVPLRKQVILLATLRASLQQNRIALTPGRWTTRARALNAVVRQVQSQAQTHLDSLIEYGYVETLGTGTATRVRVVQEWVPGMLDLSLGDEPGDWDADLVMQIGTLPPEAQWPTGVEEN